MSLRSVIVHRSHQSMKFSLRFAARLRSIPMPNRTENERQRRTVRESVVRYNLKPLGQLRHDSFAACTSTDNYASMMI
jgi:hypothetical protein